MTRAMRRALQRNERRRLQEATKIDAALLAQRKSQFDAVHNLGVLQYQRGRFVEALDCLAKAVKLAPDDFAALSNLGVVQAALNRPEEALASYDKALAANPGFAEGHNNRGGALRSLKRPADALASFEKALSLNPTYAEAHNNRGNALRDLGRSREAIASFDKALAARPALAEAHCNRGDALMDVGRPAEALASYDRALALRPRFASALNNRGAALLRLERRQESLASIEKALAVRSDYAEAHYNLGVGLLGLKRLDEALASFDRAIALNPAYVEAHNNRAVALIDLYRPEEGVVSYDDAIALRPRDPALHDNKSVALAELGRLDEARDSIDAAIRLEPKRARSHYTLTRVMRMAPGDARLSAMEDLAREMPSLATEDQIFLSFALGKAYADVDDHSLAFQNLLCGNALKRAEFSYDEVATLGLLERTRAAFNVERLRSEAGLGDPSPLPVFILGMPRSGTTLAEQILSSHPSVFGAGEIDAFGRTVAEFLGATPGMSLSPESTARISGDGFRQLGVRYVDRIRRAAPSAERIVNKTTDNFRLAGLAHLALPNARIIHMRRNPIDTCLSCFSTLFVEGMPYAYDLVELSRYYRAYDRLMAHWRAVLPQETMIEIQYEELVEDLEGQARRIVAHCGLEWSPRCLEFHKTKRQVRTASAAQVRQPIYKKSVGRWRAYESFLTPLLAEFPLSA